MNKNLRFSIFLGILTGATFIGRQQPVSTVFVRLAGMSTTIRGTNLPGMRLKGRPLPQRRLLPSVRRNSNPAFLADGGDICVGREKMGLPAAHRFRSRNWWMAHAAIGALRLPNVKSNSSRLS